MKIFMYSDLHISKTSSILPNIDNSLYTYRQQMILDTGKYLAKLVKLEKPDLIINLGDTFDQHTVTSYDIKIASEFFSNFLQFNIPHYVLVGNHEMLNRNFNAVDLLNNISNITVISENQTIQIENENVKLAFLPYCDYNEILKFPEGDFLFSHNDIQGSSIRGNVILPEGIKLDVLKQQYKVVFNGHIHKPSTLGNIVNVGSISTHSFSDDNDSVPQCYIFDTNTFDLKTFKPNICPLFRKLVIKDNIQELVSYLDTLDLNYKYIIHCVCPFQLKEQVKEILNTNTHILNSRLNVVVNDVEKVDTVNKDVSINTNIDVKQTFKDFLNTTDLKFPLNLYLDILEEVK